MGVTMGFRWISGVVGLGLLAGSAGARIIGSEMPSAPTGVIGRSKPSTRPAPARTVRSQPRPVYYQPAYAPAYGGYYAPAYGVGPSYGYGPVYGYSAPVYSGPAVVSIGAAPRIFTGAAAAAPQLVGPRSIPEITRMRIQTPQLSIPGGSVGVRQDPMLGRTQRRMDEARARFGSR